MRLLEVRDLLAGQSWWDVHQYRMNPPLARICTGRAGGPADWWGPAGLPRFLPDHAATIAAMALIPLLELLAAMLVVCRPTLRWAKARRWPGALRRCCCCFRCLPPPFADAD
jgi:hypothetical protein